MAIKNRIFIVSVSITIALLGLKWHERWNDKPIRLTEDVVDLGTLDSGSVEFSICVENKTSSPIRIVGARVNCRCARIKNLPIEVPSRSEGNISAVLNVEPTANSNRRVFAFC